MVSSVLLIATILTQYIKASITGQGMGPLEWWAGVNQEDEESEGDDKGMDE
jgi:hypothetical protein